MPPRLLPTVPLLTLIGGVVACVLAPPVPALPQDRAIQVAAFLWHESGNDEAALAGFRDGLKAARLDWQVTVHQAGGDAEAATRHLDAIREGKPSLVLALGTRATMLVKQAGGDVPVVFTAVTNPVQSGVVAGWTGSGGRLAGNSNWLPGPAMLKNFLRAVHGMRTLGVIRDPNNPVSKAEVLEITHAVEREYRGITLRVEDVATPEAITGAAQRLRNAKVDAVWIPIDHLVYRNLSRVTPTLDAAGIPIVTSSAAAARNGAVVGVIPDYRLLGMQAADLARRIVVNGEDPGRLPVGRLHTFRTVVNLHAAARCRYRVPLAVLAVADEVIR